MQVSHPHHLSSLREASVQEKRAAFAALFFFVAASALEAELQRSLYLTLVVARRGNRGKAAWIAWLVLVIASHIAGLSELRRIRGIECFQAKLKRGAFVNVEVLEQRSIQVIEVRTTRLLRAAAER